MDTPRDRSNNSSWLQGRGLMVVFAVGSAVAFLFVGVLVHLFLADQIRERERGFDEFHAEFTAQSVLAERLTDTDLAEPVTGERYEELAAFTRELVLIGGVVRVKIWNRDGTVVFSDEPDLVGGTLQEIPPALRRAFDGRSHSRLTRIDDQRRDEPLFAELPELVMESYVPLRVSGAGPPQAVAEIYQDFGPNEAAASAAVRRMDLYLGGGLLVLYVLLLPLVRRTAGTLQDQTQRLTALLDTERATVERLDELNEMKNLFITAVSHELRTPLTVVRGVAQTLVGRRGQLSEEQVTDLLQRLDGNAARLERLLGDLLDLNHLVRGTTEAERSPIHLDALVGEIVDRCDTTSHPVEVDVRVGAVEVDPGQVQRIVQSLLDNAVRHTPPGTPVWIRACRDGDHVELVVEDAGPGVSAREREAVFDAFSHGSTAATSPSPGTGVGLALVAQYARLHGGNAWVEDRHDGGASFHVTLSTVTPTGAPDSTTGAATLSG